MLVFVPSSFVYLYVFSCVSAQTTNSTQPITGTAQTTNYTQPITGAIQTTNSTQHILGTALVSGTLETSVPVTTIVPPSATPAPAWNTSLLCKHLANITSPQGSEPAPTDESLEAKCFPGFVCVNGYCTGGMSCKCFEGWAGLFCQSQCPSNCTPDGICVTSTSNQAICMCNDTSTFMPGVGCVNKTEDNDTTTAEPTSTVDPNLRSLSERECFGTVECVHGYCDLGSLQCLCDPGWRGQLCNEPCDLDCGQHGRCRENSEYVMFCVCESGFAGDNCQIDLYFNVSSTTEKMSVQRSAQESDISNMWLSLHTEDNTTSGSVNMTSLVNVTTDNAQATTEMILTLRSMEYRTCIPGYVCMFGYCYHGNGYFSCACDKGYGGVFCDQPCDIICEVNETCVITPDKYVCKCLPGYDGSPCTLPNTNDPLAGNNMADPSDIPHHSSVLSHNGKLFNLSDIYDPYQDLPDYKSLQPLALRACAPGFVCLYGNCSLEKLECECENNYVGVFCDQRCQIDCGPFGKCEISQVTNEETCFCFTSNHTGASCENIRLDDEQTVQFPWTGVAVALTLLFLTVLVLILLPYYLWKKRNITMMSIVHWLQPFEEDDGRQYDAFVSYASADLDRQFVIQTLVPRLEGRMCFTLCIHQRNFVPGLFITDNITDSVKKSRRTLLIISPAFISSSWCKFEYQMALQEMLTEKHRILPIILGDVSHLMQETDETLKTILKTVTWLEYPGKDANEQEQERFWKRLALSLPKKRQGKSQPLTNQTCLISPTVTAKSEMSSPKETKAQLEVRSFKHKAIRGIPLHQIIRVSADDLDRTSSGSHTLCIQLSRILGRSSEEDNESQDVTSSQSPLDPFYTPPPQLDPPKPDYDSDLDRVTEKDYAGSQIPEAAQWSRGNEFESKDMSALDSYLGDQNLGRQLAVC